MRNDLKIMTAAALAALIAAPGYAQDRDADAPNAYEARHGCVAAQRIVPPFNNTAASMEQSRMAARAVRSASVRRGNAEPRVCGTDLRDLREPHGVEMSDSEFARENREPIENLMGNDER